MHEDFSRQPVVTVSSDRVFGLVWTAFFTLYGLAPLRHAAAVRVWAIVAAGGLLLLSLLMPKVLHGPNLLAARLATLLHRIMNPVVMGLVFYGCFAPVGLWSRWRKKDPLRLQLDRSASTYWIDREPGPHPTSMNNQF
jgi:hypothetical protein